MSAYIETLTPMVNANILVEALCKMGFPKEQIEEFTQAQPLVGYEGSQRGEKANIIVRKRYLGNASNDLGFLQTPSGYRLIISDYDQRKYGQKWLSKLVDEYEGIIAEKKRKLEALKTNEMEAIRAAQVDYEQGQYREKIAREEERLKQIEAEQMALVEQRKTAIKAKAEAMGYEVFEKRKGKKVQLMMVRRQA